MTLRFATTRLLGVAVLTLLLVALAACDSSSAPAQTAPTPIGANPTATTISRAAVPASLPTTSADQVPQAIGTAGAGQVPQAQPTGGAAQVPQPVVTGSPVLITPGAVDPDEPPRISLEELQALLLKPDTLLVDVRSQMGYEEGHIKGAVSYPFPTIEQHINDVPKDKLIVAYCQ